MIPTDHLEIIVGAGVVAFAVVTTVATTVGALTYLIFRERPIPAAVPRAVPKTPIVHDRHAAEVPATVAG
jgi:hypothetical protein